MVIPDGLEEAWLEPGDHNHRKALEPILEPWDGTGWRRGVSDSFSCSDSLVLRQCRMRRERNPG